MAVGTGTISIRDVGTELSMVGTYSLLDCFSNACAAGFNPTYAIAGADTLRDFRGYDNTLCCQGVNLGYNASSSASACSAFPSTVYLDNGTLAGATQVWNSAACNSDGPAGYYASGGQWRYWNGTNAFTSSGVCV